MAIAEHLVASTRGRVRALLRHEVASWLWDRLRHNLPDALSCLLMPDHLHLVAPPGCRDRLCRVLAAGTRVFGIRFDVMSAETANSVAIAARMVRYGLLNPVRAGLVDDPWRWRWSSLRDLGGAAHPTWTDRDAIARSLRIPAARLLEQLASTADLRSPPLACEPVLTATFEGLVRASAAALRWTDADVLARTHGRRLVVQAAATLGLPGMRGLAERLGCCERTLYRDRARRDPALGAVLVCLADARLLDVAIPDRPSASQPLFGR
jgi:hypothetical protein